MGKKKVCFIAENALGGVVGVNRSLMEMLGSRDLEFSVVLINYAWRQVTPARAVFDEMGIPVHILDISHERNKFKMLDAFQREILSRQDLIIATDKYELIAYCIGKLNIPVIFMIHSNFEPFYTTAEYFRGIIDAYICISAEIHAKLNHILLRKQGAFEALYLPHAIPDVDLPYMDSASPAFTVAFIGRFNDIKGADIVLQVGAALREKGAQFDFIIISNGVGEEAFKEKWAFNDRTTFYSNIPNREVQEKMVNVQAVLMPSRLEGFPVVLIESMRRGVVPVCSDIATGFPELVEDGVTGFRIPISDPARFADTLILLSEDRDKLRKISAAAIGIVHEKFDPAKNAGRYLKVFLGVTDQVKEKAFPNIASQLGRFDISFIPNWLFKLIKRLYKPANQTFL